MLKTLKLRGVAIAAVLCITDTCLGIDPRLVKSSLASATLLLNRESGGDCPNVQPLEGSKDATVRKVVLLIRTPLTADGSSNHNSPLSGSKTEQAMVAPSSTNSTAKEIAQTISTPEGSISTCSAYCETESAILLRARKRLHPVPSMPRQRGLQLHHDRHEDRHK